MPIALLCLCIHSRYPIYCEALLIATVQDIVRATQCVLDTLVPEKRRAGEPEIVHDGGPQSIGRDWTHFVHTTGMTNVRTHPYHPHSNGKNERVNHSLREEVQLGDGANLYEARCVNGMYRLYNNDHHPRTGLHYLSPRDYYGGGPVLCLAERSQLCAATEVRRVY